LWDLIQTLGKKCSEAADITASVRDLPSARTNVGRVRAWLRLAAMQKRLADYVQRLTSGETADLADYYEKNALMRSEEAAVAVGLLLSVNVVDCNLCVKVTRMAIMFNDRNGVLRSPFVDA